MGTAVVDATDLMRHATEALAAPDGRARPRRPVLRTQRSSDFWPVVVLVVGLAVLTCACVVGASGDKGPPPPALAFDTSGMARVDGSRPAEGRLFVTAVRRNKPRVQVATDRIALEAAKRNMEAAKRNGIRAALSCVDQAGRHSVSVDAGRITGGSAGLMFALAIVDAIEPLEPDGLVAGTGTIAANGVVGPIGDIGLKARAASDAGADIFLAPKAQAVAAQHAAPGLRVVGVRTLDEAVRTLGRSEGCEQREGEET